jgi:hypothetical protein
MSLITLAELVTSASPAQALQKELDVATALNLPITSWQPLDPSRTIFQIQSNIISSYSVTVSALAQGAYASYAAVMPAGGSPLNDGAGFFTGWMDLRASDQYNIIRIAAGAAAGPVPVVNSSGQTYNYTAGQLHFQNPISGATFTNTANGTVTSAVGTQTILIAADPTFVGTIGTTAVGSTLIMLTPLAGVTVQPQTAALVGTPIETNAHLLSRGQAKLGAISPNGNPGAYVFVVESMPVFGTTLSDGTSFSAPSPLHPYGVTQQITRVSAPLNVGSGVVTVYCANAAGGVRGCSELAITNVTWGGGIATVTTGSPHNLNPGDYAIIFGVVGATGVNNKVASTTAWQLLTASGSSFTFAAPNPGAYVSGGSVNGADLGMADSAVQATCVPNGQVALVQAAVNVSISVSATAYIPASIGITAAQAIANINAFITTLFSLIPIGGLNAETVGIVPWSEVLSFINSANFGTNSVSKLSLNGGLQGDAGDVTLTSSQVPILAGGAGNIAVVFV